MKTNLVAILALIVVGSGCMHAADVSSQQKFDQLSSKTQDSSFHITYDLSLGSSGGSEISSILESPEMYSYQGDTKTVFQANLFGTSTTVAGFEVDNRSVTCTESTGSIIGSDSGLSCELGEESQTLAIGDSYVENPETVSMNISGTRTYAGRECRLFEVEIPGSTVNSSSLSSDSNMTADICLDKEKGYTALASINRTTDSQLSGKTTEQVLRLQVTDYSEDVSPSDVELPVSVLMEAECEDFSLKTTSLDYSGLATLSVNGANRTVQISEGSQTFNLSDKEAGDNSVKLYYEDEVSSASCYSIGTGSLDFESDFNFSQ